MHTPRPCRLPWWNSPSYKSPVFHRNFPLPWNCAPPATAVSRPAPPARPRQHHTREGARSPGCRPTRPRRTGPCSSRIAPSRAPARFPTPPARTRARRSARRAAANARGGGAVRCAQCGAWGHRECGFGALPAPTVRPVKVPLLCPRLCKGRLRLERRHLRPPRAALRRRRAAGGFGLAVLGPTCRRHAMAMVAGAGASSASVRAAETGVVMTTFPSSSRRRYSRCAGAGAGAGARQLHALRRRRAGVGSCLDPRGVEDLARRHRDPVAARGSGAAGAGAGERSFPAGRSAR
jgi:hypothetical protein